jgi:hypothetical protein
MQLLLACQQLVFSTRRHWVTQICEQKLAAPQRQKDCGLCGLTTQWNIISHFARMIVHETSLKVLRLSNCLVLLRCITESRDGFHGGKATVIFKNQYRRSFVENPPWSRNKNLKPETNAKCQTAKKSRRISRRHLFNDQSYSKSVPWDIAILERDWFRGDCLLDSEPYING